MRQIAFVVLVALVGCKDGGGGSPADPHAGHKAAAPDAPAADPHAGHGGVPEGHAEVTIPVEQQQRVGLEVARAERAELGGVIRATATIQPDEQRDAHVHSRLMGYVRKLFVNTVGQKVKKGQALYTIYSQDLLVAQQEYLRARKFSTDLAEAARERLRLWDIPEDQIRAIEASGTALETVTVRSPIAGTVIEKNVVAGHFVEPDMMLFRIADLSRLWVLADVYEYELGRVDRKGTAKVPKVLATYRRLYQQARRHVAPGGLLVACCCTSRVARGDFRHTVGAALGNGFALDRERKPELDHPVGFTQADYLKILVFKSRARAA